MRSPNGLFPRDRKRVKSAAVSTGSGTARSIPSCERPAAFAGILDVAFERRQLGILGERARRQLEQPGADDAAVHPERGDAGEVDLVVAGVHQLEAFGVRLHQAVLDAVVNHLHVVAGAVIADAQVAVLRRERQEDRLEPLADVRLAADHQAVAFVRAPRCRRSCPRRCSASAFPPASPRAAHRRGSCVLPPSMIDVAGGQQFAERFDGRFRRRAGRHHHPDGARRRRARARALRATRRPWRRPPRPA